MRYKKPIVRDLNLDAIRQFLWDIQEECENIRWYTDSDDGNDSLINALDGDEDEAYEFKMAFADLCAECDRMSEDLNDEWVPECFDYFFVAAGAGDQGGGYLGYDSYEGDYFGLFCTDSYAEEEAKKKLKTMTKDEMISAVRQCLKIYHAYIGLRNRYESLKAAIDILRDKNNQIGYIIGKMECSTDKYVYPIEMVEAELHDRYDCIKPNPDDFEEPEDYEEKLEEWELALSLYAEHTDHYNGFDADSEALQALEKIDEEWWDHRSIGAAINPRVYAWFVGLRMAWEQLHEGGKKE